VTARCHYCGDPVDPQSRFTWHRIVGWERKAVSASRKGGSDIALREQREEFACDQCVHRLQQGLAPLQEALL
jgi:hypothetical protein